MGAHDKAIENAVRAVQRHIESQMVCQTWQLADVQAYLVCNVCHVWKRGGTEQPGVPDFTFATTFLAGTDRAVEWNLMTGEVRTVRGD